MSLPLSRGGKRLARQHLSHAGGRSFSRDGGILLLAVVVLLALSILGVGLLSLASVNGMETGHAVSATQAFWLAEAGLNHAQVVLMANPSPGTLTGSGMNYFVTVVSDANGIYTLTSTGTAHSAVQVVRQTLQRTEGLAPAFDYGVFAGSGSLNLSKDSTVNGNLYVNGSVSLSGGDIITNGLIYATGSVTPGFPTGPVPDPPPAMPPLDTSYYDGRISYAATSGGAAPAFPLSLGGGTRYVKGNATLGDINGPGTLVVSGSISAGKDLVIGPNVSIIVGGSINFAKDCAMGSNCTLFAAGSMSLAKANMSSDNCTLICLGSLSASKDLSVSGLVYAGGSISLAKDATIDGCMMAGGGISAAKGLSLTWDASQLTSLVQAGFATVVHLTDLKWEQLR